jgi:hypothetical protein
MPTTVESIAGTLKAAAGTPGVARGVLDNPQELEREILNRLVTNQYEYTNAAKTTEVREPVTGREDFLSEHKLCGEDISGGLCVQLLDACLKGDSSGCVLQWNQIDWSGRIKFTDADHGAAVKLAKKLQLDTKSVDDVIMDIHKKTNYLDATGKPTDRTAGKPYATAPTLDTTPAVASSVRHAMNALKQFVSPVPVTPSRSYATGYTGPKVMLRTGYVPVRFGGGGSSCSYANLARSVDSLRNTLTMVGGGPHTAAMVRSSVSELQQLLQKQGKAIDTADLDRIHDAIDSLERSEKRVEKAREYINTLNQAIRLARIPDSSISANVTLRLIQDLAEKEKASAKALTQKALSLTDMVSNIQRLVSDVSGIKSHLGIKP